MRVITAAAVVSMVLPFATLVQGCSASAVTACHADFRAGGPFVRAGEVVDELTLRCSPTPIAHAVTVRMLYRRFEVYAPLGRAVFTTRKPDAEGYTVVAHAPCVAGWYRATASVTATSTDNQTSNLSLNGLGRVL